MPTLLLDGDENFRRTLAVALRLEGVNAREAADVDQASALMSALTFRAVVVDLLVPGARGLVARLAASGEVRLLVCSTHRESFDGVPAGAARLEKPFTAEQLLARIAS